MVWHSLLGPAWAKWLRGGKALREAPAFPQAVAAQLQEHAFAFALASPLQERLQCAFSTLPPGRVV